VGLKFRFPLVAAINNVLRPQYPPPSRPGRCCQGQLVARSMKASRVLAKHSRLILYKLDTEILTSLTHGLEVAR
jgi:hypothetical protein